MLPAESVQVHTIDAEDLELKWEALEYFQLGDGGFSQVFHVFYRGQDAVLKKSKAEFTEKEREAMRREAFIVASLHNCPNVIRLFGVCEDPMFCGMIMEYCAGPNLSNLVRKLNKLNVEMESLRVFKWCHELARTLCHLNMTHYHGDLKPQNVFVKERPCCCQDADYETVMVRDSTYKLCTTCKGVHLEHISLKIGDFGMSCEHGTPRKYRGTIRYLAPETDQGIYTEKSEVFSFGILMLTLVLGKPTDECGEEHARFLSARHNKNFDLSSCNSNSFSETITQCTHERQEDRPTFQELLGRLNGRFEHYLKLKSNDSRVEANRDREEFLDHYKMLPKKLIRTVTTSTLLSTSTFNSMLDFSDEPKYYGGPLDNDVFVDSASTSRKNSGYETPRSIENSIYTEDEPIIRNQIQLPIKMRRTENRSRRFWRILRQARNLIAQRMRKLRISRR